jgi:hypothetical protein
MIVQASLLNVISDLCYAWMERADMATMSKEYAKSEEEARAICRQLKEHLPESTYFDLVRLSDAQSNMEGEAQVWAYQQGFEDALRLVFQTTNGTRERSVHVG